MRETNHLMYRSRESEHKLAWNLLEEVAGPKGTDLRRFLNKAFQQWGRAGKLKPSFIGYIQTHIGTENNTVNCDTFFFHLLVSHFVKFSKIRNLLKLERSIRN